LAIKKLGSNPRDYLVSLKNAGFVINQINENRQGKKIIRTDIEQLMKMKDKTVNLYCFRQ